LYTTYHKFNGGPNDFIFMLTKVFNLFSCNYEKNCLRILDKLFFLYFTLLTCRVCCTYFFHIHSNFLKFCRFQLHFFPLIHIHFLTSFTFHTLSNCFTFFLGFFYLPHFLRLLHKSFASFFYLLPWDPQSFYLL
jgi:hypothetical protein